MRDGSDAVADWPLLNLMVNVASGASWASFHDGGGVGIGYSLHAGQVTVADGTDEGELRVTTVLRNDPATGCSAMPTPATTPPWRPRRVTACACPWRAGRAAGAASRDTTRPAPPPRRVRAQLQRGPTRRGDRRHRGAVPIQGRCAPARLAGGPRPQPARGEPGRRARRRSRRRSSRRPGRPSTASTCAPTTARIPASARWTSSLSCPCAACTMGECVAIARGFAAALRARAPAYLSICTKPRRFVPSGGTSKRCARGSSRRCAVGSDKPTGAPISAQPRLHPSAGATAIGARQFLVAFNMNLRSTDMARRAPSRGRSAPPAAALPREGRRRRLARAWSWSR